MYAGVSPNHPIHPSRNANAARSYGPESYGHEPVYILLICPVLDTWQLLSRLASLSLITIHDQRLALISK
jgi:hypothetical protein